MSRPDQHRPEWEPEDAVGMSYGSRGFRRWSHWWNNYLAVMVGIAGGVLVLASVSPFSGLRLAGGLLVVAAAGCIVASDRAAVRSRGRELEWILLAPVLAAAGVALFIEVWD